jgi:hypothetical protein
LIDLTFGVHTPGASYNPINIDDHQEEEYCRGLKGIPRFCVSAYNEVRQKYCTK